MQRLLDDGNEDSGCAPRVGSCCNLSPEERLAKILRDKDVEELKKFLDSSRDQENIKDLVNNPLEILFNSTPLEYGCEIDEPDLASALLDDSSVQVNGYNPILQRYAVHVASSKNSSESLQVLLKKGGDPSLRDRLHRTALHAAAEKGALECILVLLQHKSAYELLHAKDIKGYSAIAVAAVKGLRDIVKLLAKHGADVTNSCGLNGKTVQDLMPDIKLYLDATELSPIPGFVNVNTEYLHPNLNMEDELWKSVEETNISRLTSVFSRRKSLDVNVTRNGETCLLYASRNATRKRWRKTFVIIRMLLDHKADVNFEKVGGWTAAHYSAMHGDLRTLIMLMKRGADITKINVNQETPIHLLVQYAPKPIFETEEFLNWFDSVLEVQDINAKDSHGNSIMHYAAYRNLNSFTTHLLKSGADFSVSNVIGEMPCSFISKDVFTDYFDKFVTPIEDYDEQSSKIGFDYSCFFNRSRRHQNLEAEPVYQLCFPKSHWKLLSHPLIKSFIYLKWERCKHYYYVNTLFYLVYVILLTTYLTMIFPLPVTEMRIKAKSSGDAEKIKSLEGDAFSAFHGDYTDYIAAILMIWNNALVVREIFQLFIAPLRYVTRVENIIELVMISCVFAILTSFDLPGNTRRSLAVVALFFAWLELVLLLGRHRTFSISIEILTLVSKNFLHIIFWYSNFLLGFALTFHLMFEPHGEFSNFGETLLKTITMMVGEINYGEIPFQEQPVLGKILYTLFLFFVTIILMNLFTGLAVDDTRAIRKQAEIISLRSQLELVRYIENIFHSLGCETREDEDRDPGCLDLISSFCRFCTCLCMCSPVKRCFGWIGSRTLLFKSTLPKKKAQIRMHFSSRCFPKWDFIVDTEDSSTLIMDGEIVKEATQLVEAKERNDEPDDSDLDDDGKPEDENKLSAKEFKQKKEEDGGQELSLESVNKKIEQLENKLDAKFDMLFKELSNYNTNAV